MRRDARQRSVFWFRWQRRGAHLVVGMLCAGAGVLALCSTPAQATTVSTWSIAPSPNTSPAQDNELQSVACSGPSNCMAVGSASGANELTLAEAWNGTAWTIVPSPNGSTSNLNALSGVACPGPTTCVAVGAYSNGTNELTLIEMWNGSAWSIVPSPDPQPTEDNVLASVTCTSTTSCIAVGDVGSFEQTLVESWNGTTWSVVASPNVASDRNFLSGVSCTQPTSCVAVGQTQGANTQTLIESWNGAVWSIAPSPDTSPTVDQQLNQVSCTTPSFCMAVGYAELASSDATLIEAWNGSAWSIVPSPSMAASDENDLYGVSCTGPADCVAAGHWSDLGDITDQTLIESWNGAAWSIEPSANTAPADQNDLNAVTCSAISHCVAVGDYSSTGNAASLIETAPIVASGYWEVAADGGLFAYNAPFYGSMGGKPLNMPIVAMTADPATGGYWEVASDGGLFAFNAPFYGSMGGKPLNKPIVGMAYDPATGGYWEVASDGGLFGFDATFLGSMGGKPLNAPMVGMAAQPDGSGYWEVASDGGLFGFGAPFLGSTGGMHINQPVVGMATS